jgi:transposase
MSTLSIALYFPFSRVKVSGQSVAPECDVAFIDISPDLRFTPRCHRCGSPAPRVHSSNTRAVRDLDFASARVWLRYSYRKVFCGACEQVAVEELEIVEPWQRVTRRLARLIHELCKVLTVSDVARHLGLDWKTVRAIDKAALEQHYGQTDCEGLRLLAVDEIALKKGHNYMTVVIDYETGRVVWMGQGRRKETLCEFFSAMSEEQKGALEAIAMDMHEPYIQAVAQAVPHVKVVFDLFHVVAAFGRVIDKVRLSEYRKASTADREVIKGSKYLLLKRSLTSPGHRRRLKELLALNETLSQVYILRDLLVRIWRYCYRACAARALAAWCALARQVGHPELLRFAKALQRYREGILNHCDYPIHNSKLEGINNKIKLIKKRAYGFADERYFILKVKQAFDPEASTN